MKAYIITAGLIFTLLAAAHAARLMAGYSHSAGTNLPARASL
jgi:hypothetical protein